MNFIKVENNPFNKIALLVAVYTVIFIFFHLNDALFLSINDDFAVLNLLRNSSPYTLMLSYPTSQLLSELYDATPNIQWYSMLLFSSILGSFVLLHSALYELRARKKLAKIHYMLINVFAISIHVYLLLNITITSVTVWFLISSSFYWLATKRKSYIVSLALLLRFDVALGLLPLVILFNLLHYGFNTVSNKRLARVLLFSLGIITLQIQLPDQDYNDWLDWNTARAYYRDLKQEPAKDNLLNSEQVNILQTSWWTYDEAMIPTINVIDSAGSKLNVILLKIKNINFSILKKSFEDDLYKALIVSILSMSAIVFFKKSAVQTKLSLVLIALFVVSLILVRNVERVTLWLLAGTSLLIWLKTISLIPTRTNLAKSLKLLETVGVIVVIAIFSVRSYTDYHENKRLSSISNQVKNDFHKTKSMYPDAIFIPSISFPLGSMPRELFLGELFQEDDFIDYKRATGIGPAGWLSRHPFFYSFYMQEGYDSTTEAFRFYKLISSDNVYFIGYKNIISNRFIEYYNQFAPEGWHHIIDVVELDKLTLAQIKLVKK